MRRVASTSDVISISFDTPLLSKAYEEYCFFGSLAPLSLANEEN